MTRCRLDPIERLDAFPREIIRLHQGSVYVRLAPIFQDLGVSVIHRKMAPEESGEAYYLEGVSESGFEIVINSNHSRQRQRFTAAHELGHCLQDGAFLRQQRELDPLFTTLNRGADAEYCDFLQEHAWDPFADEEEVQRERTADQFAVALLMPERAINKNWRGGFRTSSELARRMGVSRQTMARRLIELKK